jgi:apolipoprotein D and lipocalin family protein
MVTGPSRAYLWILSREKMLDEQILTDLISRAKAWGFETDQLIFVEHDMPVMDVSDARMPG